MPQDKGLEVRRDDAMAEAARKIIRYHFQKMLDHEAGACAGEDAEATHRMRVATRRMRAAMRLFRPTFKKKALKPHRVGLSAAARALGHVRDYDVLLSNLRTYQADQPKKRREALAPLIEAWQSQRDRSHEALIAYLNGEAYRDFVAAFGQFLAAPFDATMLRRPLNLGGHDEALAGPTEPDVATSEVRVAAGNLIWQCYAVVRAYGPVMKQASVEQLHALRIETKYLRYVLEFFSEMLGDDARDLVKRVIVLQDHLGALNDANTAVARVNEFVGQEGSTLRPDQRRAIKAFANFREQGVRTLVEGAPGAWRELDEVGFRRRLAHALADL